MRVVPQLQSNELINESYVSLVVEGFSFYPCEGVQFSPLYRKDLFHLPSCLWASLAYPLIRKKAYPSNKIQAKVALNVSAQVSRQASQNRFFINSSSRKPLRMYKASDTMFQIFRELPMSHPLFSISSLEPPFFKPHSDRLKICLHQIHQKEDSEKKK